MKQEKSLKINYIKSISRISLAKGNFLDAFYRVDNQTRIVMIKDFPEQNGLSVEQYTYLSAMVEHLCELFYIPKPNWVNNDCFFKLSDNVYGIKNKITLDSYKTFLIKSTPLVFKKRKLYVGDETLNRR